jgi:hypothetical protein
MAQRAIQAFQVFGPTDLKGSRLTQEATPSFRMRDDKPLSQVFLGFGQGTLLLGTQGLVIERSVRHGPERRGSLVLEELEKPKRRMHFVIGQRVDQSVQAFAGLHENMLPQARGFVRRYASPEILRLAPFVASRRVR